jgi:hypothetical protein
MMSEQDETGWPDILTQVRFIHKVCWYGIHCFRVDPNTILVIKLFLLSYYQLARYMYHNFEVVHTHTTTCITLKQNGSYQPKHNTIMF